MAPAASYRLRAFRLVLAVAICMAPTLANAPTALALPGGSQNVAYVYDFGFASGHFPCSVDAGGTGINDLNPPGCGASIFRNAVTGGAIGAGNTGTYGGVNFTNVTVAAVDANPNPSTAFNGFDSVMLYMVCDIHSHPKLITALNSFLNAGGKVMIFDGDRCAASAGGVADYTGFLFPFTTSSPGPSGVKPGSYTSIDASSLTTGLPLYVDSTSPLEDSMGDANIFTSPAGPWCKSITGTNLKGVTGLVEAYATTVAGGLAIYEGEDYWFTFNDITAAVNPHYKQVFDLVLHQKWNPDGLPCTHPASGITLTPMTSTHFVGESQVLTAFVFDVNNNPKPGIVVTTTVTGPDAQVFPTQTTDPSGNATFTLTNTGGAGTDVAVASFVDIDGMTHMSKPASVIFNPRPTALTVNPATSDFHDPGTVSAILVDTSTSMPLASKTIVFMMGAESCSGTTDATGLASCPITPSEAAGTFALKATFAGDVNHVASTGSNNFVVTLEETTLSYTGPINFPNGSAATLSAVLNEDGVTPIGGSRAVTFTLGSGITAQSCIGHTAANGSASCVIPFVNQPLGPGTVSAVFAGDAFYLPSSDSRATLQFGFLASGSFVIGDGNAAVGSDVTFWGAQWAKHNSLSGGAAPRSFKGFADTTSNPPACLAGWSTDPGNSSDPPDTVPQFMAVIVSSSIDKAGSTISGDTVHIVVVQTNPGYAGNPGHAGTGTVVAVIC